MGNGRIDRSKLKDPKEVSGWGEGGGQDFSDIARDTDKNAEFVPPYGHPADIPSADGGRPSGEAPGPERGRGDRKE